MGSRAERRLIAVTVRDTLRVEESSERLTAEEDQHEHDGERDENNAGKDPQQQ